MPEVSVIIPCYNLGKYLSQSIPSVVAQTFGDWECIVVNDGSSDNTRTIADQFRQKDARIRYFEQPNAGLSGARNRGLDEALGAYIQFLDADDWLAPTKFERQLTVMKTTPNPSLSFCDYERRPDDPNAAGWSAFRLSPDLDLNRPLVDMAARWENELTIPPHCFLFDARIFRSHNLKFDQSLANHEDWDCWMQILATAPNVFYVSETLATYRFRSGSLSTDLPAMRKGFVSAIRKQQRIFRNDAEMRAVLETKLRDVKSQYDEFGVGRSAFSRLKRRMREAGRATMPKAMKRMLKKAAANASDL